MNIMEMGILFAQFSVVPNLQREAFLGDHPEIVNVDMIDWAITAARLREPEDKKRIANAALYLATKLRDKRRQTRLRQILAEV
jgi:hypothetical protein